MKKAKILTAGDSALLIEFEQRIAPEINGQITAFVHLLREQHIKGVTDLIPAFASLLINYDPRVIGYRDLKARVEELLKTKPEKEKLAFVGDGINDAPVLGRADIGIAMGAMGSDAAIEAADVVLMDDDPLKIAKAIKISRKCLGIVYQNIVFAIGIKLICLALGALGIANMWLAIFADVGVMILAVLNAIRALFVKKI